MKAKGSTSLGKILCRWATRLLRSGCFRLLPNMSKQGGNWNYHCQVKNRSSKHTGRRRPFSLLPASQSPSSMLLGRKHLRGIFQDSQATHKANRRVGVKVETKFNVLTSICISVHTCKWGRQSRQQECSEVSLLSDDA